MGKSWELTKASSDQVLPLELVPIPSRGAQICVQALTKSYAVSVPGHLVWMGPNFFFFVEQLADALVSTPFQALTMSDKAGVMAYLCNELLCSRTICKYVHSVVLCSIVNTTTNDSLQKTGLPYQLRKKKTYIVCHLYCIISCIIFWHLYWDRLLLWENVSLLCTALFMTAWKSGSSHIYCCNEKHNSGWTL